MKKVILKYGKEGPLLAGHPWIFSHALHDTSECIPGELVSVKTTEGKEIGIGYCNPLTSIRVRMLSRNPSEEIDVNFFVNKFKKLDAWKKSLLPAKTNGYRLVHAEADGLPGLIVDRYANIFVFQLHTAGMDRLRNVIIEALQTAFNPKVIVERSDLGVRKIEGLSDAPVAVRFGELDGLVAFQEAGIKFYADPLKGQKTGFFLDQRNARLAVGELAKGKRVLNLFGYTGAFSVHALKGGAEFVCTVDTSRPALETAHKNFELNKLDPEDQESCMFLEADVMDLLQDKELPGAPYDLIICDPPSFAKSERHLDQALKSYTALNQACLENLAPNGILVTSSCSGRLEASDFKSMLKLACGRSRRKAWLMNWLAQPVDHAELLVFPEGAYLKTAILQALD